MTAPANSSTAHGRQSKLILKNKRILVIDDEVALGRLLEVAFVQEGAMVTIARDGMEGLRAFYAFRPDVVILDIMMPGMDGWTVCGRIREMGNVPIIFLTARGEDADIVRGLDCGAVDYIRKPFNVQVLLARARSILRERTVPYLHTHTSTTRYQDPHMVIDVDTHLLTIGGKRVSLTKTEWRLLTYLIQNMGHVLTTEQILRQVWGSAYEDSDHYVHIYISRLRRKIEPDADAPLYILTEYGIGYRFQGNKLNTS